MSFVNTLDNNEFPPLNLANQMAKSQKVIKESSSSGILADKHQERYANFLKLKPDSRKENLNKIKKIESAKQFVKSRVGLRIRDYHQDLEQLLNEYQIGENGDFISVHLSPIRASLHANETELLPDLVLPLELWSHKVCVELVFSPVANRMPSALREFEQAFLHALYLPTLVIVIISPDTEQSHAALASIVNQSILKTAKKNVLILFRIHLSVDDAGNISDIGLAKEDQENDSNHTPEPNNHYEGEHDYESELIPLDRLPTKVAPADPKCISIDTSDETRWTNISEAVTKQPVTPKKEVVFASWQKWCSLSSHLSEDSRYGVCLSIDQDIPEDEEGLDRWKGAPVRMITIDCNRFIRKSSKGRIAMECSTRQFVKSLARANSLKTSIVLEGYIKENVREYLAYLDYFVYKLRTTKQDPLLDWNDRIQPPLQPLSYNLDSDTYCVFEMDSKKYLQYREAMVRALTHLKVHLRLQESNRRDIVLMVLGAGRGPLVDCFIDAIRTIDTDFNYKIYALDKNASSVISLKYKLHKYWRDPTGRFKVEVVHSDMRSWCPNEKADIIATELLGSLGDNELSPECIDGTWRFSTPETISIPQEYSSYVAPIYSCKFRQDLHQLHELEADVYDKIYVDRLTNYYIIDEPKELFNFKHKDLSKKPVEGQNERYQELTFTSKTNIVCHGFAGYFRAHLFGDVEISILYGKETPNMNSWFPAAIPLESPIEMPLGTSLDLHFWRKESPINVWYQWTVTRPQRSRLHSGEKTAMSKFI